MSSSPSSSSSESSSVPNSSSALPNFDPFAVHPFTNCSHVNQSNNTPQTPTNAYPYAYGPNVGNYHIRNPAQVPPSTTNSATPSSPTRKPNAPYGYSPRPAGIFVPYRKETSSPELDDLLKSKKNPGKTTSNPDSRLKTSSKSYPSTTGNPAKPIPISPVTKF